jgi:hypothetical protein
LHFQLIVETRTICQLVKEARAVTKEHPLCILKGDDSVDVNGGPLALPQIQVGVFLEFECLEKIK